MRWNLNEAVQYYKTLGAPADQTALIGLLREVQKESGGAIDRAVLAELCSHLQIKEGIALALIRRIPSLRLSDAHVLELCAGPNCGKSAELAAWAEKAGKQGKFTLKFVPCMRLCGKGPNLRLDGRLYHRADIALLEKLLEEK